MKSKQKLADWCIKACYTTIGTYLFTNFAKRMLGSSRKEKRKICPRNRDESGWKKKRENEQ